MGDMVRVLIVDDHRLFAEALRALLPAEEFEVVGMAATGAEASSAVGRIRPDVVLMDIGLPDESGIAAGRRILAAFPETKMLALTAMEHPHVVAEALRSGFHGYLTKDMPLPTLVSSLRAALDGQALIPQRIARAAAGARTFEEREAARLLAQLTPRERDVLRMLARGMGGTQIARELTVSTHTVRTHIQNILRKLGVHSRLEAVAFANANGLLSVPSGRRFA